VKRIKIKANQYAEVMADCHEGGVFFTHVEDRLHLTGQGQLFVDLVKEAVNGGKYDHPAELVTFCYRATLMAFDQLASDDRLAILAPPQSAIARKVAKSVQPDD